MKVLFLTNIPSPYRLAFFEEFSKYVDLTVIFEKSKSDERDCSWDNYSFKLFKGIVLNGNSVGVDKAFSADIIYYLRNSSFDHIIVSNLATPTGMLSMQYLIDKKIDYWIEGDGAFPKNTFDVKCLVKRHFIKHSVGCFSTAKYHDAYYMQCGATEDKIYRYPFSSVFRSEIVDKPISEDEKRVIRDKIGIPYSRMVFSVGQMIHRKGFDILIKTAKSFGEEVGFYIAGGPPTDCYISLMKELDVSNVHFLDFMSKSVLSQYYKASDVFVLPTREDIWGLVINEAMAYGLPVITTQRCNAGLEMVDEGKNGYIIPVDDYVSLTRCLEDVLSSYNKRDYMSSCSLRIANQYTIEEMAKCHYSILENK